MTATQVVLQAAADDADLAGRSTVGLADELLAHHVRVGGWVACWEPDDQALWAAVRPTLARWSRDARRAAGALADLRGRVLPDGTGRALAATAAVAPVVWAREIGTLQRLLGRALGEIERDDAADPRTAVMLERALRQTEVVAAELARATAAA